MRPAGTRGEGEIAPTAAATTAHTTSICPILHANMRPPAATAERTSEPGTQNEPQQDQHLTKSIRERPGTTSRQSSAQPKPRQKSRAQHLIISHRIGPTGQARAVAPGAQPLAWFCAATRPVVAPPLTSIRRCPAVQAAITVRNLLQHAVKCAMKTSCSASNADEGGHWYSQVCLRTYTSPLILANVLELLVRLI